MVRADRSDLLAFAEELESRDAALAAELGRLQALSARLEEIRSALRDASETLRRVPRELAHAERARAEADGLLTIARREHVPAGAHEGQRELDALAERVRHLTDLIEELRAEDRAATEQRDVIDGEAALLAEELAAGSRVGELPAWFEWAQSTLLVSRTTLEAERDLIVREAAELLTSALGEPVGPGSVVRLRQRLLRELA